MFLFSCLIARTEIVETTKLISEEVVPLHVHASSVRILFCSSLATLVYHFVVLTMLAYKEWNPILSYISLTFVNVKYFCTFASLLFVDIFGSLFRFWFTSWWFYLLHFLDIYIFISPLSVPLFEYSLDKWVCWPQVCWQITPVQDSCPSCSAFCSLTWHLTSPAGLNVLVVMFPICIWACRPLHGHQHWGCLIMMHELQGLNTNPVIFPEAGVIQLGDPQEASPVVTPDLILICIS